MTDANQSDAVVVTNQQDTALLPVAWMYERNDGQHRFVSMDRRGIILGEGPLGYTETSLFAAHRLQAKPSASCEADEATVERVARLLFVRDEGHPVSEATLNYWFSCDENSSGEDADCKRHCDEFREDARKIITALRANAPEAQRYRHKKRGTVYEIIGAAELQMSCDMLVDGSSMVIYRGEDGRLWVREESEFYDGRFEPLASGAGDDLGASGGKG